MIRLDTSACDFVSSSALEKTISRHADSLDREGSETPGFLKLPFQSKKEVRAISDEAARIRRDFEDVLCIGIGGSSLGALALLKSLRRHDGLETPKPRLHFLDNPEAGHIHLLLQKINPRKTLLIAISKSGETTESLAIFSVLYSHLRAKLGAGVKRHVLTITEEKDSTLWRIHREIGCKNYAVPLDVGGRFSVLSAVGLLPAAIAGIDIQKLLKGATGADPAQALRLAALQYHAYLDAKKPVTVFFPYGKKFDGLADWYIQLLAESIGKTKKIGPTPLKAVGAIDQHAQLQLFMDGPPNKFYLFLSAEKEPKVIIPNPFPAEQKLTILKGKNLHQLLLIERRATIEALVSTGQPVAALSLPALDERHIGELLLLLELQVAFLGKLFDIDPFDQPGVELGKKLTHRYLQT